MFLLSSLEVDSLKINFLKTVNNTISLKIEKNGVANLIFDMPNEKVNKLSKVVLEELEKAINVIDGNKAIRILIITSAKKDIFIAGADINEIRSINNQDEAYSKVSQGQKIISKIAKLKIPTIAVINGACLGGGLELALACDHRVAVINKKTSLGLPEVNLGIIPGFGGTQRLPELVGLEESLKIILTGKPVDANKAYRIGLVDEIFHEEFLEEKLTKFVSEIITNGENNLFITKKTKAQKKRFIFESLLLTKYAIFYYAKKNLWQKTKGQYLAPFVALDVIAKTYGRTYGKNGYEIELKAFCDLVVGRISKNLIELFFTNEQIKKDNGIDYDLDSKDIKNAALLGAGVMGGGIAWLFANNNISIRIKDISQKAIALGYNQIFSIFNQLKKIKKLNNEQVNIKVSNVTSGTDYTGFENTDIVIEAVVENIAVKKNVLSELENYIKTDTIVVSNTSSLSINEMSCALKNPERFAGMHFFNPVNRMPLVEVIRGQKTSDETIAAVVKLSKKLGKTPIVVKDVAGFLVNRILLTYMNEAGYIFQEGGDINLIDSVIEKFGMPMGPFFLADVVGIDIGVKVANSLEDSYGKRMKVADILNEIYKNKNLLGKKSNKGFYLYDNAGNKTSINGEIYSILDNLKNKISIKKFDIDENEILDRCLLTMVNEASKCLEEGVVKNCRYLDMAMIMGTGFPAFHGGLLKYADHYGISNVAEKLKLFNKKYGDRFAVSDLLIKMSKNNQNFYN